jgi:hypothetical protein
MLPDPPLSLSRVNGTLVSRRNRYRIGRSARAGSSPWLAAPFHQERKPTLDLSKRDCAEAGFPRRKGSRTRLRGLSCSMTARNAAGSLRYEEGSLALTGALRSRCPLPKEATGAPKPLARPPVPARASRGAGSVFPPGVAACQECLPALEERGRRVVSGVQVFDSHGRVVLAESAGAGWQAAGTSKVGASRLSTAGESELGAKTLNGCESETVPRVNGRTISLGPCGQQRSPFEITLGLAAARAARLVVASSFRRYGTRRLKLPTGTVFPEFSSGL